MLDWLVGLTEGLSLHWAFALVFVVLLLCGFGLPMPEDVVLVTGGVLAWLARTYDSDVATVDLMIRDRGLLTMVVVGLAGILAGDSAIFFLGRRFGAHVADFRPLRRIITPAKLEHVEKLMRRRGNVVVMVARFLPGLRAPTYFTAGHSRLPYWEFLVFDGAAALVSAPLWICIGYWFGSNIQEAARLAHRFSGYIVAAAIVVVLGMTLRWMQHRRTEAEAGPPPAPGEGERE